MKFKNASGHTVLYKTLRRGSAKPREKQAVNPTVQELRQSIDLWIAENRRKLLSDYTIEQRIDYANKFCWFCETNNLEVNSQTLDKFFGYLSEDQEMIRWGKEKRYEQKPLTPQTIRNFWAILRALFNFCVKNGYMKKSPLSGKTPPKVPQHHVQPFSDDQIHALLDACSRGCYPKRDKAIILLLLDTGLRVGELCSLCMEDLDTTGRSLVVKKGKGGKSRNVFFCEATLKAITTYTRTLTKEQRAPENPLFVSEIGKRFQPNGIQQMIGRLAEDSKITGVRCSPHTFRHTFAISFLRAGGGEFTLMHMLGHTSLAMTRRYCAVATADVQRVMETASPVKNLKPK
jgi:site-specific recombinase XerD